MGAAYVALALIFIKNVYMILFRRLRDAVRLPVL